MILSVDFENENEMFKAKKILSAGNIDSQILNISIFVNSEGQANDFIFQLEMEGIKFKSSFYK